MSPANSNPALAPSAGARWLRLWLSCVAFFYPLWWVTDCCLIVLPALFNVAVLGYRLKYFDVSVFEVIAYAAPAGATSGFDWSWPVPGVYGLIEGAVLVTVLAIAVWRVGRRRPALCGLAIAMLGQVASLPWLFRLSFRKEMTVETVSASLFFFLVLALGLRRMLGAGVLGGYLTRVGTLLAAFPLPMAVLWILIGLVRGFQALFFQLPWLCGASVLASLLVSLKPVPTVPDPTRAPSWKPVAAGALASVLVAAGTYEGHGALARARRAANQAAMAAFPEIDSNLPYPKLFFQKGVNFTAEFPDVYASAGARQMLQALPKYGVNAIALVPYGWSSLNPPRVRMAGEGSWESDEGLEEMARVAHALGIKVMLKPAIWRGDELDFPSASDRAQWFAQYGEFLDHYAALARRIHADLFCIGGEFVHLSPYDAEWRRLIARVREAYPGPLVYAANHGAEFETLTFWDALDYIGLQEYYPLPDDLSTAALVEKVEAVQRKYQRPVIFTEAGFPSLAAPQHQPWDDSGRRPISLDEQARCYDAILRAFYKQPWFEGVYWWRVETNGSGGPQDSSHSLWNKPAMDLVKRWYLEGGR